MGIAHKNATGLFLLFYLLYLCILVCCQNSFSPAAGEAENPGGSGETPPPAEPALPEKVYIQVRFDLHDSSGGLYNTDLSSGISGIEFQYEAFGLQTGELIKGIYHDNPKGYVWPYGFIVKYGGSKDFYGPYNQTIAK